MPTRTPPGRRPRGAVRATGLHPTEPRTDRALTEQIDAEGEPITVSSDARVPDSDGDGLSDAVEKNRTHTDPTKQVTYAVTERHQKQIVETAEAEWKNTLFKPAARLSFEALGLLGPEESPAKLEKIKLTDRTDDFDFVTAEQSTRSGVYENVSFTALDGTTRTDTWVENAKQARAETDLWDPDTDDDGLTDGQELKWVTTAEQPVGSVQQIERASLGDRGVLGTSAKTPDSDGDGYWDGWIGVYGVERTDNVVLYREHLRDDDDGDGLTVAEGDNDGGIKGEEIVQEQTGVHDVTERSATGTALPAQSGSYHSNTHIGELHWKSYDPSQPGDPSDPDITPSPSLDVEVDYYESINEAELDWFETVERSYALYGIDVEFSIDDELTRSELRCRSSTCLDEDDLPPTSLQDARAIESRFHQNTSKLYLFVSPDGDENPGPIPDYAPDVEGVASTQGSDVAGLGFGTMVFLNDHNSSITGNSEGPRRIHLAKTTTHEVGHILGVGRADDESQFVILPAEVYSGSGADNTPEEVGYSGLASDRWSVMSAGWNDPLDAPPMSGRYVSFSIEELSTIELNNIATVE